MVPVFLLSMTCIFKPAGNIFVLKKIFRIVSMQIIHSFATHPSNKTIS